MRHVARAVLVIGLGVVCLHAQVPTQPPPQPPPTAQSQNTVIPLTDYKVGPRDVLRIEVPQEQLFPPKQYPVGVDGTIFFYDSENLRAVHVSGLTTQAIQEAIRVALIKDGVLLKPAVVASVDGYRSQTFTVTGAVQRQGTFQLTADQMTLQNALVQAGGPRSDAAPEVIVRRRKAAGVPGTLDPAAINAETEEKSFIREDLDSGRIESPVLQDGDFIYVPLAKKVIVGGEVVSPGPVVLLPGMTVIQAIQKAGGFKPSASQTRIEIQRYDPKQGKYVPVKGVTATTLVQADDSITVKKKIM